MKLQAAKVGIGTLLTALRSLLCSLPRFMSSRPKTALRVLCLIAFDTIHRIRRARPLPNSKLRALAALLDLGAWANAVLDSKAFRPDELRELSQLLEEGNINLPVAEYLQRLSALEGSRPWFGGKDQFQTVRIYRETVVRLSLGMAAVTAGIVPDLDEGVRATGNDADLRLLFRVVMQCQIIDDILDYSFDHSAGLPGFLTATESLARGFELTHLAAADYANDHGGREGELLPLKVALLLVSNLARFTIHLGRWRHHVHVAQRFTRRVIPFHR